MIQNGTGLAEYDSEIDRYYKHDFESSEGGGGYVTNQTLVGSSPETNFDVTYDGTDTVARRETYVLTFRPMEDTDSLRRGLISVTLWVDEECWFPLKHEVVHDIREEGLLQPDTDEDLQGETYFQAMTFEEIAFDAGIDDARFRVPEDADRVE